MQFVSDSGARLLYRIVAQELIRWESLWAYEMVYIERKCTDEVAEILASKEREKTQKNLAALGSSIDLGFRFYTQWHG